MEALLEPIAATTRAPHAGRSFSRSAQSQLPTQTPRVLCPFFWLAARAPWLVRAIQPIAIRLVPLVSRPVRTNTRANATRIFGRPLGGPEQRAFTRGIINSFYEFIIDIGQSSRDTHGQLLARIAHVEGAEAYRTVRANGRGAVLVTAHMGSFEIGLAALKREEERVYVVFKRDASSVFDSIRAKMRRTLGVIEAPIDDGLGTWMDLRDALLSNHVVVMQADRAMPGQRSEVVPFLHGHLRIPTGAVRLARMTGSPIVPVYTVRLASGRFAVHLHPPIDPGSGSGATSGLADPAVFAIARSIETMVRAHPDQWLALGAAFEEDAANA